MEDIRQWTNILQISTIQASRDMTGAIHDGISPVTGLRREAVYARIRQDILSCALAPGAPLYEGVLAETYAVSK
jgi:hypothetical protein